MQVQAGWRVCWSAGWRVRVPRARLGQSGNLLVLVAVPGLVLVLPALVVAHKRKPATERARDLYGAGCPGLPCQTRMY